MPTPSRYGYLAFIPKQIQIVQILLQFPELTFLGLD